MELKLSPKFSYGLASLSSGVLAVALLTPATAATPAPAESGEPVSETKKISSIEVSSLRSGGNGSLREAIKSAPDLKLVWLGLPCGTASRARERPAEVKNSARPIRTDEEPWGRKDVDLTSTERLQLEKANQVYRFALEVIGLCSKRGVAWVIENPANSLLWSTPEFAQLQGEQSNADIEYSACMVGGSRDKRQRLRGSVWPLAHLRGLQCDKSHNHATG